LKFAEEIRPLQASVPSTSAIAENLDATAEALAQMASRQISRKPTGAGDAKKK